jgi:thiol-disulfide isomerase/thioredoxin
MKTTFKYIAICFIATLIAVSAKAGARPQKPVMPADSLMNDTAPDFVLKDLNGKTVSLADYKGKILVLDFWATWCSYCRKSFPSTQLLINKYKNNPKVAFLFVDAREMKENYLELIHKLLTDNHYTFHVVLDEKGPDGVQNKIYTQYAVEGLPTKYIIDGKGTIRYKILGYDQDKPNADEVRDLSALIDAVRKL